MTAEAKQRKVRTCSNPGCGATFVPAMGQKECSWACKQAVNPVAPKATKPAKEPKPRKPSPPRKAPMQRKPMIRRTPMVQRVSREQAPAAKKPKARADHIAEVQALFNEFIRLRDAGLPCISCGKNDAQVDAQAVSGWDCGHYRTVGACPELRFEPLNCARQCRLCNRHMSGNIARYRPRLIQRIGLEKVEWLEGAHAPRKYTVDDLKAIKADCRAKIKALKGSVG